MWYAHFSVFFSLIQLKTQDRIHKATIREFWKVNEKVDRTGKSILKGGWQSGELLVFTFLPFISPGLAFPVSCNFVWKTDKKGSSSQRTGKRTFRGMEDFVFFWSALRPRNKAANLHRDMRGSHRGSFHFSIFFHCLPPTRGADYTQ